MTNLNMKINVIISVTSRLSDYQFLMARESRCPLEINIGLLIKNELSMVREKST